MFIKDFKNIPQVPTTNICEVQNTYSWNKNTKTFESHDVDLQEKINNSKVPSFKECINRGMDIITTKTERVYGDATPFAAKNATDYFNAVQNEEILRNANIIIETSKAEVKKSTGIVKSDITTEVVNSDTLVGSADV